MQLDRRNFLKNIGVCGLSFGLRVSLINQIISGVRQEFMSQAYGGNAIKRNYVLFNLSGGPARWTYDLPLQQKNEEIIDNPMVKTKIKNLGKDFTKLSLEYATYEQNEFLFPYLWQLNVAGTNGKRPLRNLLENCLFIRGCDLGQDGHENNNAKIVAPIIGGPSITGIVAENSTRPIPSLSFNSSPASQSFKSPLGFSDFIVPSNGPNLIDNFYFTFKRPKENFRHKKELDKEIMSALNSLDNQMSTHLSNSALISCREKAEFLIRKGISGLNNDFEKLVNKYTDLINQSIIKTNIPGLTDKKIPGVNFPIKAKGTHDTRSFFAPYIHELAYIEGQDLRDIYTQSMLPNWAQSFALTEFVLKNKLSSSIVLNLPHLHNLTFAETTSPLKIIRTLKNGHTEFYKKYYVANADQPRSFYSRKGTFYFLNIFPFDSHGTGSLFTLLSTSLIFQAFGSCLTELIDQLKTYPNGKGNLFDETILHLSSEFTRTPRVTQDGSDHAWMGHVCSIYSGIISGPIVLGNIYQETKLFRQMGYGGTWGQGAPVAGLDNRTINMGNISSTLAFLLGTESPIPREKSLLKFQDGKITPTIENGRMVRET